MKLATNVQLTPDLRVLIQDRFAEFNRHSSPSRGRKYPQELKDLVRQGAAAGIKPGELKRLSGMSDTAIKGALSKKGGQIPRQAAAVPKLVPAVMRAAAKAAPRRLEVVQTTTHAPCLTQPIVVRLKSGVAIEFADSSQLTSAFLATLSAMEVGHAASR